MVRIITLKLNDKSENVEHIIKSISRLYEDEIDFFRITNEK